MAGNAGRRRVASGRCKPEFFTVSTAYAMQRTQAAMRAGALRGW